MGKVAILKFEDDGSVTGTVIDSTSDIETKATLEESGTYAFVDVQEIEIEGSAPAKKVATKKAATKKAAAKKGK